MLTGGHLLGHQELMFVCIITFKTTEMSLKANCFHGVIFFETLCLFSSHFPEFTFLHHKAQVKSIRIMLYNRMRCLC